MKTKFTKYENMPLSKKWFDNYIKNLSYNRKSLNINKDYVVELNKNNSKIVENDINNNESYNANFTRKIYDYYRHINNNSFPKTGNRALQPIIDLIRMIGLENSTNIWRYKEKRHLLKNMAKYITDGNNNFWKRLYRGDVKLVDDLREASNATTDGPKSLASKICKYFSEMFYNRDNYYINDRVVRHVLPYYLEHYSINKKENTKTYFNNLSYCELHEYLESIRTKTCSSLKKRNVDHIMWYCYRSEKVKEEN